MTAARTEAGDSRGLPTAHGGAAGPLPPRILPARDVAIIGLVHNQAELRELENIQAIQRWICFLEDRRHASKFATKP